MQAVKTASIALLRLAPVALAAAACSSSPAAATAPDASDEASDSVECAGDASPFPVDTYRANIVRTGMSGALTFTIVSSDPAPPEVMVMNTFTVSVTRADGSPFTGSLVIPFDGLWMPLHGHSTTIPPVVMAGAAPGMFTVYPTFFFMPGLWRVTMQGVDPPEAGADDADADAAATQTMPRSPTDSAVFYFCL